MLDDHLLYFFQINRDVEYKNGQKLVQNRFQTNPIATSRSHLATTNDANFRRLDSQSHGSKTLPKTEKILFFVWNQNSVDDVHDAVGRDVVRVSDLGHAIDEHVSMGIFLHQNLAALERLDLLLRLQIRGVHGAAEHVVLEHGQQVPHVLRLEEELEQARGKFLERLVGGGEHGEGARARQRGSEVGVLDGRDEGRQVLVRLR